jgi:LIM domain kinase 1
LGEEFDLPTDIFSLGVIFCEIAARQLADDNHFKRLPPAFDIDAAEVRRLASPDCPPDFVDLCLDCLKLNPLERPTTRMILERLAKMEQELLSKPEADSENVHVGSIKFLTGGKRPGAAPRIPSFGMGVAKDIKANGQASAHASGGEDSDEDEEFIEALSKMGIRPRDVWNESTGSDLPLLDNTPTKSDGSNYSTSVIRSHSSRLSSVMTIRPAPDPAAIPPPTDPLPTTSGPPIMNDTSIFSINTLDTYHTATGSAVSSALATEGGSSSIKSLDTSASEITQRSSGGAGGGIHRFTSIKPGTKPRKVSISGAAPPGIEMTPPGEHGGSVMGGFVWNPLDLFFSSGLLMAKCDVCYKRLGWRPVMACDDCGMKCVSFLQLSGRREAK